MIHLFLMFDVSRIVSSQARFRVLRRLLQHHHPVGLRELQRYCDLSVRSIQVAVRGLNLEGVLTVNSSGNRLKIKLVEGHPCFPFLKSMFRQLEMEILRHRSKTYHSSAQKSLLFASDFHDFFKDIHKV
jgi:hypothetical protein